MAATLSGVAFEKTALVRTKNFVASKISVQLNVNSTLLNFGDCWQYGNRTVIVHFFSFPFFKQRDNPSNLPILGDSPGLQREVDDLC